MAKIVLISCVSKKATHPAPAKDLYESTLFKFCYSYAMSLCPDKIFVLSAQYGLVAIDEIIYTYYLTLKTIKTKDILSFDS